jgi:hypothetical protein
MAGPEFNKEHAHCFFRRGLFTMNLFLLPLQSILTFTVTFWDAREKMCDEKDRNFGANTTGSFITTQPPRRPWKPQFVTNNNMVNVPHPPCSPSLASCDFVLFPNLKRKLKERRFETGLTSKRNRKWYSTAVRKMTSTVFLKRGKNEWDCCIHSQGDYFEGNGSQIWLSYASISFFT